MLKLLELIKICVYKERYNSQTYIDYLRKKGVQIGEHTVFFSPRTNVVDDNRPYLLKIGSRCKITAGVTILAHDYSISVLRPVYHFITNDSTRQTVIGDNVFLGINSVIMGGVKIGNNVIVATGAIVTKDVPDNSVVAGVPAKVICTLDDFYKKKKASQIKDAFQLVNIIRQEYKREPTISEMGNFSTLFLSRNEESRKKYLFTRLSGDVEEEIVEDFYASKPVFENFDEFLEMSKK